MIEIMTDESDKEWQIFLTKINEYVDHPSSKWTSYTLLAYFLVKYKKVNSTDFIFSYGKRGPTKSRELKQSVAIWEMFNRGRYNRYNTKEEKLAYKEQLIGILKEYIDWAFDVKFRGRNTNVTGLGIFAVNNVMNEFLQYRKAKLQSLPRRSDPLPSAFIAWIESNAAIIWKKQQLAVLEDLNALYNYVEAYDPSHVSIEAIVLDKAIEMGVMPKNGKLELERK